MSLSITQDWTGSPSNVPPYNVTFSISQSTGDIMINVDAPYHDDPKPPHPAGKVDDLHKYEVVEIFISAFPSTYHEECPYLEIEVGPHGHYFLGFFLEEAGFDNVDTTIDFENRPRIRIDYEKKRWKCEIAVPSFLLPEPVCGDDFSVTWRANVFAIHGEDDQRQYLAHAPAPGDRPNFHQLNTFQEIKLFETMEVRSQVPRNISIANEKIKKKTAALQNEDSDSSFAPSTVFNVTEQLRQAALDDAATSSSKTTEVDQVARQIRDRLLKGDLPSHLLDLEERFQRQIQADEFVVLHDTVWKRKALSFRRRKLILTSKPRLFYLDGKGEYRGQIPWTITKRITAQKISDKRFNVTVFDNSRTYNFSFSQIGADIWVDTINQLVDAQKKYLRKSGIN